MGGDFAGLRVAVELDLAAKEMIYEVTKDPIGIDDGRLDFDAALWRK